MRMRKPLIVLAILATICFLAISLPALGGSYKKSIMQPWIGASKDELVSKWGYPQTQDDLVKVNDETVMFTYHSFFSNVACHVSFTIKNDFVISYKYRGGNCPKLKWAHIDEKRRLVTISWPIEFTETSGATDNVKAECWLPEQLPRYIKQYAEEMNVLAADVSDNTEGWVLHMEIVNVIGLGGGGWSGRKSVTVEGKLTENGEVIGTITATRSTGHGGQGTCSLLGRCLNALGKDIAQWLIYPTMDAKIGEPPHVSPWPHPGTSSSPPE